MIETFISWYLNNWFGKYFQVNSQQLSLAFSKGEGELENVPLKKNIFRNWGLPIEIKSGVVGKIKVNIGKYFKSEPVLVSVEDVYLVAGPLNLSELDPHEEEALAHESKMSALDSHEARWKTNFDLQSSNSSYSSLYVSSMRIGASILTKFAENVQLNVTNVHIRFEEEVNNKVIGFGITLQALVMQNCDIKWNPLSSSSSSSTNDAWFWNLRMTKLGLYVDTKGERHSELSPEELKNTMSKLLPGAIYLLSPVSAEARVAKNNANHSLTTSAKPRFDVYLTLEKVPLQLSDSQYKAILHLYKSLRKLNRNTRLRHYRPFCGIKGNGAEWWGYATQAVLSLRGYRRRKKLRSWAEVLQRGRDNLGYVRAYQQHLSEQVLSSDDRKLRDRMEADLHYEDILELRQVAMRNIERAQLPNEAPAVSMEIVPSPNPTEEPKASNSSGGILSWFFPSWTAQASASETKILAAAEESNLNLNLAERTMSESEFDEAILGEMRAFGKDALLARINFNLSAGSVLLHRANGPFLDLSFGGVSVELLLKPRSGSHKFQLKLSTLILRDSVTKSPILAPHSGSGSTNYPVLAQAQQQQLPAGNMPLFNLVYEAKPHRRAGHRVTVSTKPMDLILTPSTWDEVGSFFSVRLEEDYLEAPYNGYEAMKKKTKEELTVYWERLVHTRISDAGPGVAAGASSSWEIYMDIFAPQITIYGYASKESDRNRKPPGKLTRAPQKSECAVIIDLGRFKFSNLESEDNDKLVVSPILSPGSGDGDEEETEEWGTPCSSPAPELEPEIDMTPTVSSPRRRSLNFGDSLDEIHAKFYKKYNLEVADVQVIIVDGKGGTWKGAQSKGTSPLHFVDRFSINLQLERRLVYSEDPLWPALTLVGSLPKLTFHLNEPKLQTLRLVASAFSSNEAALTSAPSLGSLESSQSFFGGGGSQSNISFVPENEARGSESEPQKLNPSKLFVAEFTIHSVSVDLASRGRNVAELQIVGTKTILTHREEDTEFSFVIQSLLLADAVQTFGPDYQLLLASHRHVCMDSISGSLVDSEPTSPMSPVSPQSPMPPVTMTTTRPGGLNSNLEIPSQLHDALLNSLQARRRVKALGVGADTTPIAASDALITIDVVLTKKEDQLAVVTVQFNNLDVIANQETVVEIHAFLQAVIPSSTNSNLPHSEPLPKTSESSMVLLESAGVGGRKIQAHFEFHRLNILLLRGVVGKDGNQMARKIATATASNARVNCNLQNSILTVDGSLGGLQVLNLTPEGHAHQRVLSVGQDPLVDASYNPLNSDSGSTFSIPSSGSLGEAALSFRYERKEHDADDAALPSLNLRMASVIYVHCSLFLFDLQKCINQFQTPFASSLKSAATQIALGLVRPGTEPGSNYAYRSPFGSLVSLEHLDFESPDFQNPELGLPKPSEHSRQRLKLDVVLDSPIIVLPRSRESAEVLVAHLGEISIGGSETSSSSSSPRASPSPESAVRYNVFIRDVSLYSLNLRQRWRVMENFKLTNPASNMATLMRAVDLYRCDPTVAIPILHNTVLSFNLSYTEEASSPEVYYQEEPPSLLSFSSQDRAQGPRLELVGRVISSLKVSLTPEQYSQLLDSVGNVAYASEDSFHINEVVEESGRRREKWEEDKLSFKRGINPSAAPLPSPSRSAEENSLIIYSCFEVPELIVELVLPENSPNSTTKDFPSLCLSCSDLHFSADKKGHITSMSISLKALKLEDLAADVDSWKRVLALSKNILEEAKPQHDLTSQLNRANAEPVSSSCPDLRVSSSIKIVEPSESELLFSSSAPDRDFVLPGSSLRKASLNPKAQPLTPPPSPRPGACAGASSNSNLVQILVTLVDPKSPSFLTAHGGNHKHVDVDFNTLDVLLTPDTFSALRRFFGDAAQDQIQSGHQSSSPSSSEDGGRNSETVIKVKALNLKLAGIRGHLAEAEVASVSCELKARGQYYFGVEGRLGSLIVKDISPYAGLYPVKFAFQGDQALDFDYTRNGSNGNFRLAMSSIVVVHTNRFYSEFMALWNSLFGSQPPSQSFNPEFESSSNLPEPPGTRVNLNIQAGAPVILLPYSSTSESILVADLGHLSVRNKFVEEGKLVINLITVDLIQMDLYSGELAPSEKLNNGKGWQLHEGWSVIKTLGPGPRAASFLKQQAQLNLKVRRVAEGPVAEGVATTRVQGVLSTLHCTLDPDKYKLIRGLLAHNIGENIGPIEDYSMNLHQNIPNTHPPLFPSRSATSLTSQASFSSQTKLGSKIDLNVQLDLVNVSLDVLQSDGGHLGRVDFIRSKFTFQSNGDGTKDVDLASQEILVVDSRAEGSKDSSESNIFTHILQQSVAPVPHVASSSSSSASGSPLQAEIHYRLSSRGTGVTIVLNNMRLMLILDWWMEVRDFLSQHIPAPGGLSPELNLNLAQVERVKNASPLLERSRGLSSPVTVSAGIVTKRAPVLDVPQSLFELKINVSNCELVVVEKASVWDTNALILKASAVLGYRPHLERPISCNILQCELFSCILGLESDSALSILDPTNIQLDIVRQLETESQGILDATLSMASCGKILKIQSPSLNLRLSYFDMKMFIRLMDKFSKEARLHFIKGEGSFTSEVETEVGIEAMENPAPLPFEIEQLMLMGFSQEGAEEALEETHGCLEDAVYLLTNTSSSSTNTKSCKISDNISATGDFKGNRLGSRKGSNNSHSIRSEASHSVATATPEPGLHGIEVKCNCLSLCVIDDCKDSDVPVVEISVQQLELYTNCLENSSSADCILGVDYYNRTLSGWEPLLEPWKCNIKVKKNLLGQLDDYSPSTEFPSRAPELEFLISSRSVLELNVTSSLLHLYSTVSSNWSEDYVHKNDRRRAPFVPFALKNETGSSLWFSTIISNSEEVFRQQQKGAGNYISEGDRWFEVAQGSSQNFSFEGRGKLRHRNTHALKTHQLAIRVDGWNEVTPVSVDRVGVYFRVAKPETTLRRFGGYMELPPTRLVLEVSLVGSAQKLVTVRSALMIKNALPQAVELKLENTIVYPSFERAQTGGSMIVQVKPGAAYPVPLHSVWAHMWIRPVIPDNYPLLYAYCTKALLIGSAQQEGLRECMPRAPEADRPYRFCVAVKRNEFPADGDELIPLNSLPNIVQLMSSSNRANLITLQSPLKLVNLLPHEISYEIKGQGISGRIGPGKTDAMSNVDTTEPIEIHYQVDNFPSGVTVTINPKSSHLVQRAKLVDAQKRLLLLSLKIVKEEGGVLAISLTCPCWIVNKSGLPLLCKQEGTSGEAAGQFSEHEVGRMVTPLMMSFADTEGSEGLAFRVGTGLHKDSKPYWCRSLIAQNGLRVRKLTVGHPHNVPESVYMVGVEIKNGSGRYRDTKLVVVSPRFIVDNRSSGRIQIAQRAYASSFFDAKGAKTHLSLPAGCNLPFHWPRLDKEQLLCVRLNEGDKDKGESYWSGGFPIDNVDSFQINIRDSEGKCHFLRVEIVLQGPSYFVIFNDTTQLPPPFRIDNFSLVPLLFHQTCLAEERLKISARPESCLPYALDEPTQHAHLTLAAPGGSSLIVNMDDLRYLSQLTYENFFYIAFTSTFGPEGQSSILRSGMESRELVLDVEGTKVVLGKKEDGKRSQLWRVNADGLIEHEGSSPPRDPKKPSGDGVAMLVLDIAGPAPLPTQCVPLMLRKPDRRRSSTQHWEFTADGRMKCWNYENLYVQAKDGFGSGGNDESPPKSPGSGAWQLWSDVVLGPSQPVCYVRTDAGIPAEQGVGRQKLRPGSGMLSLAVETDGPTRVLRIIDVEHPPRHTLLHSTFEENDYNTTPKYRVKIDLPAGFGISVIACNPREELLYGRFSGFALEWTDTKNSTILSASVLNLQLDNMLLEQEKSAVLYVPSSRSETVEDFSSAPSFLTQPALHLYAEGMKSNLNARVFKVWELGAKPISLIIEERLLLKLSGWWGLGQRVESLDMLQQADFEVQKALSSTASVATRRYYFGSLKIMLSQVKLSVLTSSKLPPELGRLKRRLGLSLIRFEDAIVELDPFVKSHPFETFEFLWTLVVKHYRDELVSQAAVILGSTDFLGNPLGFVNDVSEGVSLMIYEGSVGALVKNVAHGLSNSAAKVTSTLGEGLGKTTLDDKHEEGRRKIKESHGSHGSSSSGDYLYAGLKGFGHGLIGGVTSVVSQSYEGVANEGFTGLFTGLTKGIVGTFTKPAVGVLDLATGAASAIRDSSKTSSRMIPGRIRPTRVVIGNGGLLPLYSEAAARGQELLFELNERNYSELFIACETLKSGPNQDLRIMISSEAITVFRPGKGNPAMLKIPLSELIECRLATGVHDQDNVPYIELVRSLREGPCRPQVICENEVVAKRVVQQVNYAKVLFEEMRHSQLPTNTNNTEE